MDDDHRALAHIRAQSRRFVQSVFSSFALMFAGLALLARNRPDAFSMPAADMPQIATSFLFLAAAYLLTLYAWDWLFNGAD
jgi:hypothetical protein